MRLTNALEMISQLFAQNRIQPGRTSADVYKWQIYYDGAAGLSSFLERVEEIRVARGVSKSSLFNSSVDLFKGNTLAWFRPKRESIREWDDLMTRLKSTFLLRNYEYDLWDENRNRTQGVHEKVWSYIANMEGLFGRLSKKPDAMERVAFIRQNLQVYPQQALGVRSILSVSELNSLCSQYEGIRLRDLAYRRSPSTLLISGALKFLR